MFLFEAGQDRTSSTTLSVTLLLVQFLFCLPKRCSRSRSCLKKYGSGSRLRPAKTCTGDKNIVNISLETSAWSEWTRVAIAALEADFLVSAAPIAVAWLPVIRSGRSWAHFERKTSAHHFGVQAWTCFRAPSVFFCTGLTFLYSQLSRIGNLFSPKCPVKHYVGTLSILPDTMLILSTSNFGAKKNCLFINI